MTDAPEAWYRRPDAAASFVRARAAAAGIAVLENADADGAPRVLLNAESPAGPPITLSARLQGPTVRVIAHHVTRGPVTATALENYNLVNRTPWAGRAYPSPDASATDVSLGLPAPAGPGDAFPLAEQLGIVHAAAVQLALGRMPEYVGPRLPDPAGVMTRARAWAATIGSPERLPDGAIVVQSTLPGGGQARVEVFVAQDAVLAVRVVPTGDAAVATRSAPEGLLRALASWNAGAPGGAAAWGPPALGVHGICSVPGGLVDVGDDTFAWVLDRAQEAAAGGLWAVASWSD